MNILDFYASIPNTKQKSNQTLGLGISQKLSLYGVDPPKTRLGAPC